MTLCAPIEYLPASYNGIPFEILSTEDKFEKGNWLFETPMSNAFSSTDTGRKAGKYTLNGYLNGQDHVERLTALKSAFDIMGLGVLMHPIWGILNVKALSFSSKNDLIEKRRESEFSLEFIEAGDAFSSFGFSANPLQVITSAINVMSDIAQISFLTNWVVSPTTEAVAVNVSNAVRSEMSQVTGKEWGAYDRLSMPSLWGANPKSAILAIVNAIDIIKTKSLPVERLVKLSRLAPQHNTTTSQESKAVDGIYSLIGILSAGALAGLTVKEKFRTINQAWDRLDYIIKILDQEQQIASQKCDLNLVRSIGSARAKIEKGVLSEAINLPSVKLHNLTMQMPSLIAAHSLFGNATRAYELENYNHTMTPMNIGIQAWGLTK